MCEIWNMDINMFLQNVTYADIPNKTLFQCNMFSTQKRSISLYNFHQQCLSVHLQCVSIKLL